MSTNDLLDSAAGLLDGAVALRRRIHVEPEIGLELPVTQQAVLEAVDGLPLAVRTGTETTSVVATLDGDRPGRTILLRGDMDALPLHEETGLEFSSTMDDRMHACGHDAHVAMLAGAARLLSDRRAEIAGRVVFMFQPGEEGYHGARVMIEEGLLADPVDGAFALHTTPTHRSGIITARPGPTMASGDVLTVRVHGRGGHASAPHLAADPIPVACEIALALQTMVTRSIDVFDPAVVTIAQIKSGTTNNIIPERAVMVGTIRAVSEKTRRKVHELIQRVADGVAAAHGMGAEVEITEGYPVTENDPDFARYALRVAADLLGADRVQEMPHPVMGAEDFSYVLQQVPGAMAFLGTRPDGMRSAPANHSNRMLLDEPAMATGIAMHAAIALDFLAV